MLQTRITEQYGLKVPFINAGMAFVATAPLVRAVFSARSDGLQSTRRQVADEASSRDITKWCFDHCTAHSWPSHSRIQQAAAGSAAPQTHDDLARGEENPFPVACRLPLLEPRSKHDLERPG
jgi:hypothetical protein